MASPTEKLSGIHRFEPVTPDLVLDALDTVGLRGDGRLMAPSSYENRVCQVHWKMAGGQVLPAQAVSSSASGRPRHIAELIKTCNPTSQGK